MQPRRENRTIEHNNFSAAQMLEIGGVCQRKFSSVSISRTPVPPKPAATAHSGHGTFIFSESTVVDYRLRAYHILIQAFFAFSNLEDRERF